MRDSTAYQAILDEGTERGRAEGQIEEARKLLFRWGTKRLVQAPGTCCARILAPKGRSKGAWGNAPGVPPGETSRRKRWDAVRLGRCPRLLMSVDDPDRQVR